MMIEMTSLQRRALRARVLAEIDRGLKAHELIKVRVYGVERNERETLLAAICNRLEAAPVQHIGNILVVYRANPEAPVKPAKPARKTASRARPKPPARAASPRQRLKK